jgi:hypothetical protein
MARRRRDDDEDDDLPKKKAVRRDEEEDEDLDEDLESDEPSRNNAYTGILTISLVALIAACVIFYLDASELSSSPIPQPGISVPGLGEEKQALPVPGKQP